MDNENSSLIPSASRSPVDQGKMPPSVNKRKVLVPINQLSRKRFKDKSHPNGPVYSPPAQGMNSPFGGNQQPFTDKKTPSPPYIPGQHNPDPPRPVDTPPSNILKEDPSSVVKPSLPAPEMPALVINDPRFQIEQNDLSDEDTRSSKRLKTGW